MGAPVPVGLLGEVEAEVGGQVLVDKLVEAVKSTPLIERSMVEGPTPSQTKASSDRSRKLIAPADPSST